MDPEMVPEMDPETVPETVPEMEPEISDVFLIEKNIFWFWAQFRGPLSGSICGLCFQLHFLAMFSALNLPPTMPYEAL